MSAENAEPLQLANYKSPQEIADRIPGMTVSNLAQLRFKGQGPKYMKPSPKVVIYDWADVVAWLESTKRDGTAEVA
ncbi:helix-turn-helix transcriptional regulator [Leucobacter sp. HY1910]